jgi:hypothetical protein
MLFGEVGSPEFGRVRATFARVLCAEGEAECHVLPGVGGVGDEL